MRAEEPEDMKILASPEQCLGDVLFSCFWKQNEAFILRALWNGGGRTSGTIHPAFAFGAMKGLLLAV